MFTPSIAASIENVLDGASLKGRYIVDVVSAASADVVSTASPRRMEVRNAGSLEASYKPTDVRRDDRGLGVERAGLFFFRPRLGDDARSQREEHDALGGILVIRISPSRTVFNDDLVTPFDGAVVTLTDADENQTTATTNAAGNRYVRESDWKPVFPIGSFTDDAGNAVVSVSIVGSDPSNPAQMMTHIGRDGSCAACHFGSGPTPSTSTPGPVYVTTGSP